MSRDRESSNGNEGLELHDCGRMKECVVMLKKVGVGDLGESKGQTSLNEPECGLK